MLTHRLASVAALVASLTAFVVLTASVAAAADAEVALRTATAQINSAVTDIGTVEKTVKESGRAGRSAEQRIADAVLLMGVKDYDRAADVLNGVVEQYPDHPTAYADGLHLLGETYFLSGQYLSARRVFDRLLDRGGERRFAAFRERAVVRLVDIALRLRDFASLDSVFAKIGTASADASSALAYARGKGLYAQGKLSQAHRSLQSVDRKSHFAHQARYLLGVVAVTEATPAAPPEGAKPRPVPPSRYAAAVEVFREVTQLPATSKEQRHVIDLAWLAIGRLLYESSQWDDAIEAYNRIDRSSPEFGTMLYELAWVYVKLGDVLRAQRALEVLSVAAPNNEDVADASLLRADLMLRAGQFEKSLKVYESVRGTYESMRDRVDAFLKSTTDPGVYFDTLSKDQLELFEGGSLPALVVQWARDGKDGEIAFAIIDDVALCRRLIKQSNEMIERLNAVLSSPNRVRALPGLRSGAERALGLLNAVAMARVQLAHGMEDVEDSDLSPQLKRIRAQRKQLEKRLGMIPVTASDFASRDTQANRQWNRASQALQRLELEVDTLQATVNGLKRMLDDGPNSGVVRSPQQINQFRQALVQQQALLKHYRAQIAQLRGFTEAGKIQVGFGDRRFIEDAKVRVAFRQLLWQEAKLAQQGEGGRDLAVYAGRIIPVLTRGDQADGRIEGVLADIERRANRKANELRVIVSAETANIVKYSIRLEQLDREARLLVGGVAARNFGLVHDRLRNIVLRADVGITEEAWEVREEQLTRVRRLRIERARGERRLQEELDEVLDDSVDLEDE